VDWFSVLRGLPAATQCVHQHAREAAAAAEKQRGAETALSPRGAVGKSELQMLFAKCCRWLARAELTALFCFATSAFQQQTSHATF
jgi:hypothetical protein